MIHLVTAENRHLYEAEIEQHYRIRHDIYIAERKWQGLLSHDGIERDQFDTADATYLLAIEQERVVGGLRVLPTTKPHLLSEVFPQLAEVKGLPRAPDIVECTRLFAVKERRNGWNHGALVGQIVCGNLEYCLGAGISAFTFMFEAWYLPRLHELGWKIDPLGLPALIENGWWIAAIVSVDEETLAASCQFCGIERPILVRKDTSQRQYQ